MKLFLLSFGSEMEKLPHFPSTFFFRTEIETGWSTRTVSHRSQTLDSCETGINQSVTCNQSCSCDHTCSEDDDCTLFYRNWWRLYSVVVEKWNHCRHSKPGSKSEFSLYFEDLFRIITDFKTNVSFSYDPPALFLYSSPPKKINPLFSHTLRNTNQKGPEL